MKCLRIYHFHVNSGIEFDSKEGFHIPLGIFEDLQETKASVPAVAMYEPRKENTAVYDSLFETFKDLYKCNKKNFHKLNGERS